MSTACTVIRNPVSRGAVPPARLDAALADARHAGWRITVVETTSAGAAEALAREAVSGGADVVAVSGGDGTLNEAINGMMSEPGCTAALAVIPGGTANIWAKETGIPRDPERAVQTMLAGARRRVDLGRAGQRYFLLMAGIGLDAEIVPRVSPALKRRLGAASYLVAGVSTAFATRPWRARVRVDGSPGRRETSLYWMLVGNTRSYGGFTDILYRAVADDGLLDVAIMHRGGVVNLANAAARVFFNRHDRLKNVDYVTAREVEVLTPGIPVHIDGEPAGCTPMRFAAAPSALTAIVPASHATPLFARPPDAT